MTIIILYRMFERTIAITMLKSVGNKSEVGMENSVADKMAASSVSGWVNGLLGVIIFSGSLPATRVAVLDMDPFFLTFLRASIAGTLAVILVYYFREKRPQAAQFAPLIIVSVGVIVGFPLLTAMALKHIDAAHSIVYLGLLPLSTAIFGVLRGGERPTIAFWIFLFWVAYW